MKEERQGRGGKKEMKKRGEKSDHGRGRGRKKETEC